jgi:tetratricopeptide (TPR) repeat protein
MPPAATIDHLIATLPYPVARPAAVAFGQIQGPSPQTRLWDVSFAAYQILRMATLPVAADYLEAPICTAEMPSPRAVASIATALALIRNPHFSDWIGVLHTLAKHVTPEKVGITPCLPLASAVATLDSERIPLFAPQYRAGNQSPHYALLGLRNGLAHGGHMPDPSACELLLAHYLPALEKMLSAFHFLEQAELRVRDGQFNGPGTPVRILRGPEVHHPVPLEHDELWLDGLEHAAAAMRVPDGRVIGLWPLFTAGSDAPVGLYDGHYLLDTVGPGERRIRERFVFYLGVEHGRWTDTAAIDPLVEKLEARRVQWRTDRQHVAPWTIAECVRFTSAGTIADLEGRKYFPACYVERDELAAEWQRFLRQDEIHPEARRYRNGLVIVGAAGSGKTAWAAHTTSDLLREGLPRKATDPTSGDARNLVLFLRGDLIAERTREDRLLAALLERLGLRDRDFASFGDLLQALARQWPNDRVPGRRFILILDAVNEAPRAENLFREALDLIAAASTHPWCRIVVTMRREFLNVLRGKADATEKDIFFGAEPHLYAPYEESASLRRRDPVIELPVLSADSSGTLGEASRAYERYRLNGLADEPGCLTPWTELDLPTRELLRSPLLLYVFHRRWSGRHTVRAGDRLDLFRGYVEQLFGEQPGLERVCLSVVRRIVSKGRADLTEEDAHDLRHAWAEGLTVAELRFRLSPMEALIGAGLVRRRTQGHATGYVFVFETVLEYLIFRAWELENPGLPLDMLKRLVDDGRRYEWFPAYWAGFQFVFDRLLEQDRAEDWPELVNDESPSPLDAVAARRWAAGAMSSVLPPNASRELVLATPAGRVVAAFARQQRMWAARQISILYNEILRRARPEWPQICLEQAGAIYARLVNVGGGWKLASYLASLDNHLGSALLARGDLPAAIAAHQRARTILVRLAEVDGRCELTSDLASVDRHLGIALAQRGDLADAIAAFERARAIYARVVEVEGRCELANELDERRQQPGQCTSRARRSRRRNCGVRAGAGDFGAVGRSRGPVGTREPTRERQQQPGQCTSDPRRCGGRHCSIRTRASDPRLAAGA